jgi:CRISPR system Cascade subunit CasE
MADGCNADGVSTHRITFFGVQYEGILEVTDTQKFFQTLCSGIGPAKGLGMGLLSMARA